MNFIDVKITVWNRLHFDDAVHMPGLVELINESGIQQVTDPDLGYLEDEVLQDTERTVLVSDNWKLSTIQVYEAGQLIWQNGE